MKTKIKTDSMKKRINEKYYMHLIIYTQFIINFYVCRVVISNLVA